MRLFDCDRLESETWDSGIVSFVAQIHEYKGRQALFLKEPEAVLRRMEETAGLQSVEASNRIERIGTTRTQLKRLLAGETLPRNRDEEALLGYRNATRLLNDQDPDVPFTPGLILQLHQEVMKLTGVTDAGRYKTVPNVVSGVLRSGERVTVFEPLAPSDTPDAMASLCAAYQAAIRKGAVDELILSPCFILNFLCVHPFRDGNGRVSRLLTRLLLERQGYAVSRYVSLEKTIADTAESYYAALRKSDQGWKEGENDPRPFIRYLLAVILAGYRDWESRFESGAGRRVTAYSLVKRFAADRLGAFSKQDVLEACPRIAGSSAEASLKRLVDERYLFRIGAGRVTRYARTESLG